MSHLHIALRSSSTSTTGKVIVFSLISTNPTVTIGNIVYTVGSGLTAVSIGEDGVGGVTDSAATAPVALYSWITGTISGLSPNKEYPITVTQNAYSITGTLRTMPDSTSVKIGGAFVSCDPNEGMSVGSSKGAWGYIREQVELGKVQFVIHTDDHGYTDSYTLDKSLFDSGINDRFAVQSPTTTSREYTYALGYASYLGLIPSDTRHHDEDKIWCHHNLPFVVGTGDHELLQNPEDGTSVTAAHLIDGFAAYKKTVGACALGYLNPSVNAATIDRIGPLEIINYDRVFGLTAATQVFDPVAQESNNILTVNSAAATIRWLGTAADQQNVIIAAVDTESPFKILAMSTDPYFMMSKADRLTALAGAWTEWTYLGAQDPLHGSTVTADGTSEWTELVTKKVGDSIVSKCIEYGGVLVGLHGDTHRPFVTHHYKPETPTHHALSMFEFSAGSVGGRGQSPLHPDIANVMLVDNEIYGYQGSSYIWTPSNTPISEPSVNPMNSCILLEAENDNGSWRLTVNIVSVQEGTAEGTIEYTKTLLANETPTLGLGSI
jgi:hypothetical protein